MILFVQTNIPGRLLVWLTLPSGRIVGRVAKDIGPGQSDQLLGLVDDLIRQQPGKVAVKRIVVVRGPGPFTPIRTGFVIGQTLAMIWGVPIFGVVAKHPLTDERVATAVKSLAAKKDSRGRLRPFYGRQPNISRPKRTPYFGAQQHAGQGRGRTAVKSNRKRRTIL